ncbi:GNAT family N-acetyltransferase [Streptomyces sp. NPDC058286]|uniref:GNAT family N-acetyltransferase n=1 Tax=Streptomyces sp. NPDC058286 TaxID=3346422 RepID=UPI0036EFAD77
MKANVVEPALGPGDVPERFETDGLVLRRWEPDDLDDRYRALTASFHHLHPWMEWATEPPTEEEHRERFQHALRWPSDGNYNFGIFDLRSGAILGMAAVHDQLGPGGVEIGYWCHVDHIGRGVISRSARELTRILLSLQHVQRVEIHCDAANLRSAAIPARLGYRLDRIENDEIQAPAESGRGMVWIKER